MAVLWQYCKVQAWLVIEDVELPLSQFRLDFELGGIPRAQCMLPVGREVATLAASKVHDLIDGLQEMKSAQIYMTMETVAGDEGVKVLGVPEGEFVVFDGYTAGTGYTRTVNGAQFTVSLNHWLIRLNETSILSKSSHPGNPAFFTFGALQESDDLGALDYSDVTMAHKYISASTLTSDLWGDALHPWLVSMCNRDGFLAIDANLQGSGKNDAALEVLKLMGKDVADYQPLTLDLDVEEHLEDAISADVAAISGNASIPNATLWDLLITQLAPSYCFTIVPRVDTALVAPYVPCYRGDDGEPFVSFGADEYVASQNSRTLQRPLRAYGILSGVTSRLGANMPADGPSAKALGIGGLYDTKREGATIISSGPRWMGHLVAPRTNAAAASGGNLNPIGNAAHPGAGKPNPKRGSPKAQAPATKLMLDKYARVRYCEEVLRGRQTVVNGVVRFDAAPGSLVRVEGAGDLFIADQDKLGASFFGTVLRYGVWFDAEAQTGGSSFHLGHVRNDAENNDDSVTVTGHPLYKNTFAGCPIL